MNIVGLKHYAREKLSAIDPGLPMFSPASVSPALGETASDLSRTLQSMLVQMEAPSRQRSRLETSVTGSVEEALYDSLAASKIMASKVSMHFDDRWRRELFSKLDDLLSHDGWQEGDSPLAGPSFETYLRFHLHVRPSREPSFGISNAGNLLAGWIRDRSRLTIEFLPQDVLRWVLARYLDDERETAAAQVTIPRFLTVLEPFDPPFWFALAAAPGR